jgi:hypothetical protein
MERTNDRMSRNTASGPRSKRAAGSNPRSAPQAIVVGSPLPQAGGGAVSLPLPPTPSPFAILPSRPSATWRRSGGCYHQAPGISLALRTRGPLFLATEITEDTEKRSGSFICSRETLTKYSPFRLVLHGFVFPL